MPQDVSEEVGKSELDPLSHSYRELARRGQEVLIQAAPQSNFGGGDFYALSVRATQLLRSVASVLQRRCRPNAHFVKCRVRVPGAQERVRVPFRVPTHSVLDNTTGVGRHLCDKHSVTETFQAFAAYYEFDFRFYG